MKSSIQIAICFSIVSFVNPVMAKPTDCSLYPSIKGLDSSVARLDFMNKLAMAEQKAGGPRKSKSQYMVTLKADGTVSAIKILNSSGSKNEDDYHVGLIRAAAPFRPYNSKLGDSKCKVDFFDHFTQVGNRQFDFDAKAINDSGLVAKSETLKVLEKPEHLDAFQVK